MPTKANYTSPLSVLTGYVGILLMAFMLAGCNDPKEANKGNFEDAINKFFEENTVCIYTGQARYPDDVNQWKEDGFLTISEDGTTVNLTKEGEGLYRSMNNMNMPPFCFGKKRVTEIVNFTAPAAEFGPTMSRVTYTYKVTDIPQWALNSPLFNENNYLSSKMEKPQKAKTILILTNEGWLAGSTNIEKHRLER
jgi:hypothetical protein